jgi:hypothetical protein
MKCEYCGKKFIKWKKNGMGAYLKHLRLHKQIELQGNTFSKFAELFKGKDEIKVEICRGLSKVCDMLNRIEFE